MKKFIKANTLTIVGALLGAAIGYFYWQTVGCTSGTCSITSKPINSTIYFAILGVLVFNLFKKETVKSHVE